MPTMDTYPGRHIAGIAVDLARCEMGNTQAEVVEMVVTVVAAVAANRKLSSPRY